jgi:hypothetical protein
MLVVELVVLVQPELIAAFPVPHPFGKRGHCLRRVCEAEILYQIIWREHRVRFHRDVPGQRDQLRRQVIRNAGLVPRNQPSRLPAGEGGVQAVASFAQPAAQESPSRQLPGDIVLVIRCEGHFRILVSHRDPGLAGAHLSGDQNLIAARTQVLFKVIGDSEERHTRQDGDHDH